MHEAQPLVTETEITNALQDRPLRRVRRREHLVDAQPFAIVEHKICKGSAGIDAEKVHAG